MQATSNQQSVFICINNYDKVKHYSQK